MKWLRRSGVTVLLLAPIAVVLAVAWPSSGAGAVSSDEDGGAIGLGETADGVVAIAGVTHYSFVASGGTVTIGVRGGTNAVGGTLDPTLTLVDAASGDQLASVDDSNGSTDPELSVDTQDGQEIRIEVRGFGDSGGSFSVYVDDGAASGRGDDGGPVTTVIVPVPPRPALPPDTVIGD